MRSFINYFLEFDIENQCLVVPDRLMSSGPVSLSRNSMRVNHFDLSECRRLFYGRNRSELLETLFACLLGRHIFWDRAEYNSDLFISCSRHLTEHKYDSLSAKFVNTRLSFAYASLFPKLSACLRSIGLARFARSFRHYQTLNVFVALHYCFRRRLPELQTD